MNALVIEHLSKAYDKFRLEDINLTLPAGCIMGLIGENGAGKSTLIRLILGAAIKDGGAVSVLGYPNSAPQVKEEIGFVADEQVFPDRLTPLQLGKVMSDIYHSWQPESYRRFLNRFSLPPTQEIRKFSRGMGMKLGLAVALSHAPRLLILDEATGGLDPVAREDILDLLYEFTRDPDHSVLISSHIVSDLEKLCDYVAFLKNGRLMLCEEKDRLSEEYGLIRISESELSTLDPAAVVHKKVTPYGCEALVKRALLPRGIKASPVEIEELFVAMAKEETV